MGIGSRRKSELYGRRDNPFTPGTAQALPGWPLPAYTGHAVTLSSACAGRTGFTMPPAMTRLRSTLLGLTLALVAASSFSQQIWKWRDANGRLQISDQPPPTSVPEKSIVSRPGGQTLSIVPVAEAAAAASAASTPVRADAELEARKRKVQADKAAAEAERKQADQQRDATRKADACRRARNQLAMLESGARASRAHDKGEQEMLDDRGRADEINRSREAVTAHCTVAN